MGAGLFQHAPHGAERVTSSGEVGFSPGPPGLATPVPAGVLPVHNAADLCFSPWYPWNRLWVSKLEQIATDVPAKIVRIS